MGKKKREKLKFETKREEKIVGKIKKNATKRNTPKNQRPNGSIWRLEMPIQYEGIVAEHQAVRSQAGLFDVSHMGEFEFNGKGARKLVQFLTANDIAASALGAGSILCFSTKMAAQ